MMNNEKIFNYKNKNSFYSSTKWRKLRKLKLSINPLCEICYKKEVITPAIEIDHIIPISIDKSKALNINNLQSLCSECHMRKTAEENRNRNINLKKGKIINLKWIK